MPDHPGIIRLTQMQQAHGFTFNIKPRPVDWLCWVEVSAGKKNWKLLVHDEYHDLNGQKPLVCLFLVLSTLEDYGESDDYLEWCKEYLIKPPELMDYYQSLAAMYQEIEALIGEVDPCISPFDYELRAGEYAALVSG